MDKLRELGTEVKIFDPCDTATGSEEVADASVVKRKEQWWMYLAGQASGHGATDIYSASLLSGSPLSATGWKLTRSATGHLTPLAARRVSSVWDGKGGRHCPSYVTGWDPQKGQWVERIYYGGAAENLWGPYTIGFLQWDGQQWVDQPEPAFTASEAWEHGSVYEPNLIMRAAGAALFGHLLRFTCRKCPGVSPVAERNASEKLEGLLNPSRCAISFSGSSVCSR